MRQVQTILSSNFFVIMFWDAYEIKLTNIQYSVGMESGDDFTILRC